MTSTAKSVWFAAIMGVMVSATGVCAADSKAAGGSPSPPPSFILRQQIDGEVSKVDAKSGFVVVNIPTGKLKIVSPAVSASTLTKGDAVLVEVGLLPGKAGASEPSRSQNRTGGDAAILRERLRGQVAAISAKKGTLKLLVPAGTIELWLPSTLLERFKKDDSIPVELALLPQKDGDRVERAGLASLLLSIFGKK
jgi:hypothetical protein